jgi:hypothetical protein
VPSIFERLRGLFPGFRSSYAAKVETPADRAGRLLTETKAAIDRSRARPRPSTEERIPTNYHGGIAGKVWFLPYQDSTTKDTPEIRAAMRLMRRDGYVKAAFEPQILTVASEDWQVQASEAGNAESEEQAEFCKRVIEEHVADGMVAVTRAILAPLGSDGHSLAEPVWGYCRKGRNAGKIVLEKFAARDTDQGTGNVRLQGDRFGNVTGVQALRVEGQPVYPIEDFVFTRYMTVFDEPLGEAAYRAAYGPYWMRDTVRKLRIIHCEKKMAGMLVGTYTDDDDKPALDERLKAAKTATWMSVPEGVRVEAVQLSTASEPDYRSFEESLRDEIVTAIAFATLQIIQGNVPDARGDSKTQKSMYDLGPWLLMTLVSEAVNKQLFPKLVDYNYPYPAGGAYPKLTFGAASNQELLELIQVVEGAQAIGFQNLSKKHYAKALSLQLADPNDHEDTLSPGGAMGGAMGGLGGGFPPGGGFPGGGLDDGTGGVGAGLPPFDPMGGAGGMGAEGFSEWDSFAWMAAQTRGKSGAKAVWNGPGTRRPLYGERARRALASGSAGDQSSTTTTPAGPTTTPEHTSGAVKPPEPPKPPAPPKSPVAGSSVDLPAPSPGPIPGPGEPAPARGRVRRAAGALGRGAAKAAAAKIYAASKSTQAAAYVARGLGKRLKRVGWLESWFGVGSAIEKNAARKLEHSRTTAEAAGRGDLKEAGKRATSAAAKVLSIEFKANRRKYGFVPAVVMEAAFWSLKAATSVGLGIATGGISTFSGPARKVVSMVLSPVIRKAVEYPFRTATRLLSSTSANPHAAGRVAQRADIARSAGKGPSSIGAGAGAARAREILAAAGPGEFFPEGRGARTTRSRRYSEAWEVESFAEADGLSMVVDLRQMAEAALGHQLNVSDDEIAQVLESLFDYVDALGQGEDQAFCEWFAEVAPEWDEADWESFGWQAGRTRAGAVKAIGTGPQSGQTLYGARARSALARESGAGSRQTSPRSVTYDVTDPEGNTTRKRETGVSPERARAMAVASKVAALEGGAGGDRPTEVKVRRDRSAKGTAGAAERLTAVAQAAAAGDPAAAREVSAYGADLAKTAAPAIAAIPAPPPAVTAGIKGAWNRAAKEMGTAERREGNSLFSELAGGFHNDGARAASWVGRAAAWLGKLSGRAAVLAVKGLARFARFGLRALGKTLSLGYRAGKAVLGSETVKPFLYWGAAMAASAAVLAAPVLAVHFGLIKFGVGLGLAVPAVVAVGYIGKKLGRKSADAGLVATGNQAIVPPEDRHAELANRFGEGAGHLVECFAWDQWQKQGEKWKSPGGRVLSDEAYQRLKGRSKPAANTQTGSTASSPAPKKAGRFAPPASPEPGKVYQVDPARIMVDPARFQFKLNTDSAGVTKELQSVGKFDPELAGVIAVWRDPADGKSYVVNGHHRLELAKRTGTRDVAVRYLNARTPEEARAKGALINIAEGRGTAVDAAKFLRDTGRSAEDLAQVGVSLKGQVARDAVELAKLSPALFRRVTFGAVEPDRAVAVAKHLADHGAQEKLIGAVEKQEERSGRAVPARVVEAMAQEYRDAPSLSKTHDTLFGPIDEDESVYFHRAELKSYVRNELAKEARDFRLGASSRRAEALKSVAGNNLDTGENKKVADRADASLATFDGQARLKGPLSDLLNDFATEYANASSGGKAALRPKALAAVRKLLSGLDPGSVPRVGQRSPGLFD